jgi:hypothetical protein
MQPKIKKTVMNFVSLTSVFLFSFSLASGDSQQADSQTLGACFVGQPGVEVCAQLTEQECSGLAAFWREGKCPPTDFPPQMSDAI